MNSGIDSGGFTNVRSLLGALAEAMNLIDNSVTDHHQQTAYLSYKIAKAAGFDDKLTELTVYSSLLHDVGSVIFPYRKFSEADEMYPRVISKLGAGMLKGLTYFEDIAVVVDNCQIPWEELQSAFDDGADINPDFLRVASVIHLADYVSLALGQRDKVSLLSCAKIICEDVKSKRGRVFSPEAADAFSDIAQLEYVWFDMEFHPSFLMLFTGSLHELSLEKTVVITQLMTHIIDYRSAFTAMHSAGVSASAMKLAQLSGMSKAECLMMKIAGNLHDLGKLGVSSKILEKPGRLTDEEFNAVKEHPYNTYHILSHIDGFETISRWAGYHHEKLNGKGYPFHLSGADLDTGSRILAVADIFSAITEVRPYRAGMPKDTAVKVLKENVDYGAISGDIVALLLDNYDEVDFIRDKISRAAGNRYFESLDGSGSGATA